MKKFNQARVNGGSNYDSTLMRVVKGPNQMGPSPSGDTVKLRETSKALTTAARRKVWVQHRGNDLGDGKNVRDATMGDPQPSATASGLCVQFND